MKYFRRSIGACMLAITVAPISAHTAGGAVSDAQVARIHLEMEVPYLNFNKPISNPDGCGAAVRVVPASDLTNQQSCLSLAMSALWLEDR